AGPYTRRMTAYDSASLDAQFNVRDLVPEHPEHFRNWAAWSRDAMRGGARDLDVRYGGGANEHLDIFRTSREQAPVLVFIHGGYWRSMDKKDHAFVAPAFAREGVCVVVPNYALCPAVTLPDIVMQMVRALAWTWKHIGHHGGDRDRIHVAGHSAGGHLAAMMAACAWDVFDPKLPKDLLKGALSISGLHDLEPVMHSPYLQSSLLDAGAGAQGEPRAAARTGPRQALQHQRRARDRGIPPADPADPRRVGCAARAGVRINSGNEPLQRARSLRRPREPGA
ncbi:MAG TPA: alpha/beta hydrolase, partial [Ramlibacter sp.]